MTHQDFIPAEPTEDQDKEAFFWLTADSGIPFHPTEKDNLRVIATAMGIEVTQPERGRLLIHFPAPYRWNKRLRFCAMLGTLASHYSVEHPHLEPFE